jgi:RNA polymerase II subunit A small phosphatase-like protein
MSRKCLALDLDETLVHSSFQYVSQADYRIPVKIDGQVHDVFVIKRPGVDEFLTRMAAKYEIFIFTASLSKYANPLLDRLDTSRVISHRLFRENCVFSQGSFVKDLSFIGRPLDQTIIVDNSAQSFIFHPENAIGCSSFIDDPSDVELWQIADFLDSIADVEDVRYHCPDWRSW